MNPEYQMVAEAFVKHFYTCYDTPGRKQELQNVYHDSALLTFEGDQKQGKADIIARHMAITFNTAHSVTRIDSQPTEDGGVLVLVLGQVQTEGEDKPLGFTHSFFLKPVNGSYFIFHEIFQLVTHNF